MPLPLHSLPLWTGSTRTDRPTSQLPATVSASLSSTIASQIGRLTDLENELKVARGKDAGKG